MSEEYRPGLEGVIATDTEISFLDTEAEQIVIRGYDLIELARAVDYPEIAYLLIRGELPTPEQRLAFDEALAEEAPLPAEAVAVLGSLPGGLDAMDALRTGLSALAGSEDPAFLRDHSRSANEAKAVRLLARAPAVAVNGYRATHGEPLVEPDPALGFAARFLAMVPGARTEPEDVRVFDRILTCYSEHELANSTLTARVVASTLADMYGAIVAATAALKGPLHGGANEAAARMFVEIAERGGPDAADAFVLEKLERKERIMGFGHRVYMGKPDPRAELLEEDLAALAERRPETEPTVRTYRIVADAMQREKGLYPNTDYPIGLILHLLDVPIDLFTPIFLCARIAGLAAHVIEQHENNRLYRPRVLYTGPRDLHVEPAN